MHSRYITTTFLHGTHDRRTIHGRDIDIGFYVVTFKSVFLCYTYPINQLYAKNRVILDRDISRIARTLMSSIE